LKKYANQLEELANQRAQRLKDSERTAIGQTAGMVGHDIRYHLQAITSDEDKLTIKACRKKRTIIVTWKTQV
jgi:hypothetical protein